MANICEICGKKALYGKRVSHSHRRSPRAFEANLQKLKVNLNGKTKMIKVCASCIKAGKIVKA